MLQHRPECTTDDVAVIDNGYELNMVVQFYLLPICIPWTGYVLGLRATLALQSLIFIRFSSIVHYGILRNAMIVAFAIRPRLSRPQSSGNAIQSLLLINMRNTPRHVLQQRSRTDHSEFVR
jgi:hypothetical protein